MVLSILVLLLSFLDPDWDIGYQQRIVFIIRGCVDVSLAMLFLGGYMGGTRPCEPIKIIII